MALVVKAQSGGNIQRVLATTQASAGFDQAQLHLILQRRESRLFLEAAHELVLAQAGYLGQFVKFEFLAKVRMHEFPGVLQVVALFSGFARGSLEQLTQQAEKRLFPQSGLFRVDSGEFDDGLEQGLVVQHALFEGRAGWRVIEVIVGDDLT
ncbi:hypothetical protein D3C81_1761480 [compost metagenome]